MFPRTPSPGSDVILVDSALARALRKGNQWVAIIGAGFMGRGLANQIINSVPGMGLVAIANRTLAGTPSGPTPRPDVPMPSPLPSGSARPGRQSPVGLRSRPTSSCPDSTVVDVIVDATGAVEYGCHVVRRAIERQTHVVLMNAEVDATVGPMLAEVRQARGSCHRLRRRPARRADEPRSLRPGHRPDAAGLRQYQGPAGPLPHPDHQTGFAERGARIRTW